MEYEPDLPTLLAAADLVLCRSGATSIAEITVLGVPSVLVPLPGAPGDHQTANARHLVEAGGALLLPDDELDGPALAELLGPLLGDPERLGTMATAARTAGRPEAADRLADLIAHYAAPRREDGPDA